MKLIVIAIVLFIIIAVSFYYFIRKSIKYKNMWLDVFKQLLSERQLFEEQLKYQQLAQKNSNETSKILTKISKRKLNASTLNDLRSGVLPKDEDDAL